MSTAPETYDIVIRGGRVMDPESGLDAFRDLGIKDGRIAAVSLERLSGGEVIDAAGLVVAPGFIDLDASPENVRYRLLDGVTSLLDLRRGTTDVARWYGELVGRMPAHFGTSIGYARVRREVMGERGRLDRETRIDASESELAEIIRWIERGLDEGAIAVGMGGSEWQAPASFELRETFRAAAQARAHVVATIRDASWTRTDVPALLSEIIGAAAMSGASIHIPHLTSSGGPHTRWMLRMIELGRARGLDVTAEEYPYTAAVYRIRPGGLSRSQQEDLGEAYWLDTGERVTRESAAQRDRDALATVTNLAIATNSSIEPFVAQALAHPATSVASHGYIDQAGRGHPRTSGTYSRLLGHYVRERKVLPLMDALRKASLMPAQRLEARVPAMQNKGRIRVGADADIVAFDADRTTDRATYKDPTLPPEGLRYVLVGGRVVVSRHHPGGGSSRPAAAC